MNHFADTPFFHPDQIFGIVSEFAEDKRDNKLNLCIGVYRSDDGNPMLFDVVRDVERHFLDFEEHKGYLAIRGDHLFCERTGQLIFGEDLYARIAERTYINQTVGGTGALRTAGEFIERELRSEIYLPTPSWANHAPIFSEVGLTTQQYPYFDPETKSLDFSKMHEGLSSIPNGSCILLHASCHNPCGCDPSPEMWDAIADLCEKKELLPIFDCAYQGFGDGIALDNYAVRLFAERGMDMLVAYSFSKNMGLYGERTGALVVVAQDASVITNVGSCLRHLVRTNYSNCPRHGALIARAILSDDARRSAWIAELEGVRKHILSLRYMLVESLERALPDHDWRFFLRQKGMFSMCGFSEEVVKRLKAEFGIYMTRSSRINVAALNSHSIAYFVEAITKALV